MDTNILREALQSEYQDAAKALTIAKSEVMLSKFMGDGVGLQDAKGREKDARARMKACKSELSKL